MSWCTRNHRAWSSVSFSQSLATGAGLRLDRSMCMWLSAEVRNGRTQLSSISVKWFNWQAHQPQNILRFGFGWPLCAFTNYIYLLTYLFTQLTTDHTLTQTSTASHAIFSTAYQMMSPPLRPCQPSDAIWRHTYSAAVTTLTDTACTYSDYSGPRGGVAA